jgi:DNA-directed RNA polymerase-5 subunit 1
MKTVAKGILKDHLVPVASNTTCSGNLNGFNNVGYKVTFHPLKVQVPLAESTLFTPMKCMRRLQRDAILIPWDVWSHHVRGASMQYLTLDHLLRLCNENPLKGNTEYVVGLYADLALVRTDQEKARYTFLTMWTTLLKTTRWMISAYHQNWMEPLECPLLNLAANFDTSEKSEFRKSSAMANSSWEQNASA